MTLFELIFIGIALLISVLLLIMLVLKRQDRDTAPGPSVIPSGDSGRKSWNPNAPGGSEKRNWLVGRTGNLTHRTFYLGQRTITIGRGVSNPIQVANGKASRVHCRIETIGEGIQVVDMNSANGTLVNGRVIQRHFLKHGDEINVGDDVFVFHERGNFTQDDTLGAKAGGAKASDTTRMVRPELMPGFEKTDFSEEE